MKQLQMPEHILGNLIDKVWPTGSDFKCERNKRFPTHFGSYEVDIYLEAYDCGIVIECDGMRYHSGAFEFHRDRVKDRWFNARGILVCRFTAKEIYANAGAVWLEVGEQMALLLDRRIGEEAVVMFGEAIQAQILVLRDTLAVAQKETEAREKEMRAEISRREAINAELIAECKAIKSEIEWVRGDIEDMDEELREIVNVYGSMDNFHFIFTALNES